ncbi:hypothetical protein [Nocardioides pacificus]
MRSDDDRPVLAGLVALVAVGLVVGLVAGLAVLVGTRMLGVNGDAAASTGTTAGETLYLPEPRATEQASGPLITLAPGDEESESGGEPSDEPSKSEAPKKEITLQSGQTSVGPMSQIDLSGVYPKGEGAILKVQRFEETGWSDFGVTASVSGGIFSTYVETGRVGENRFRMVDTDTDLASNEVRVTVQ